MTSRTPNFPSQAGFLNLAQAQESETLLEALSKNKEDGSQIDQLYKKALTLYFQKDYQPCTNLINDIYKIDPDHIGAMELQGMIAYEQGRYEISEIIYTQLCEKELENPDFKIGLGEVYLRQSRFDLAENIFAGLTDRKDLDDATRGKTWFGLTKTKLSQGNLKDAGQAIENAYKNTPQDSDILYMYATFFLKKENAPEIEKHIEATKALLEKAEEDEEKSLLGFTLARLYMLAENYEDSYRALEAACAQKRQNLYYDPDEFSEYVQSIIDYFSEDFLTKYRLAGHESTQPVFIISLPRSGTTLLEQMLSAHPEIDTVGENTLLSMLIDTQSYMPPLGEAVYPLRLRKKGTFLTAEAIAHEYANYLYNKKGPQTGRILNKSLSLRFFVGLLYKVFPNARFIHIHRAPLDCLLSCLSTNFTGNTQPYSYDLEELGRHYNDHQKLMRYWESVIPAESWKNISYEDLVSAPEQHLKDILEFLNIDWNPACLEFHKQKKEVNTASAAQVRESIHQKAIGKWSGYLPYITKLKNILEDGI